jgi:hypothetical protein
VTSWEALITPSPPNTFEGGGWFVGWWTEPMHDGWIIISHYIYQYVPPEYRTAALIGLSLYPFFAFFLLLFPSYRKLPREFVSDHQADFPTYLFVGVFLALSGWAFSAATGSAVGGGAKFLLAVLSIPAVLALIALLLSSIVWIPAGLFLLPAWLFWILSQPFKVVYFLVVRVPLMVLHGLHYLMVPHPVEEAIKQYEAVRAREGANINYASFAKKMAQTRYNRIREGIPAWWKSKNWEKRLKDVNALRGRVHVEKVIADKYTEEFRKDHRENK